MRIASTLIALFLFFSFNAYSQNYDLLSKIGDIYKIDRLVAGSSFRKRIEEAIKFTDATISAKIGRENFIKFYEFDSSFNDIVWRQFENGELKEYSESTYDNFEDVVDYDREIIHYNFSYRNKDRSRRFGLHVQLAANKSYIDMQGLIAPTSERNISNVMTQQEFKDVILKAKLKRKIKKHIKKNFDKVRITHDSDQIGNSDFYKIYYSIYLRDIEEPAWYKFDPWTGKLCCIVK